MCHQIRIWWHIHIDQPIFLSISYKRNKFYICFTYFPREIFARKCLFRRILAHIYFFGFWMPLECACWVQILQNHCQPIVHTCWSACHWSACWVKIFQNTFCVTLNIHNMLKILNIHNMTFNDPTNEINRELHFILLSFLWFFKNIMYIQSNTESVLLKLCGWHTHQRIRHGMWYGLTVVLK